MVRYIFRRLLWMIPIVLGVAVVVFTLMTFCPGDPAQIILGGVATEDEVKVMHETLGLDKPYFIRLGKFLSDTFLHLELGRSWLSGQDIKSAIAERLPRTFALSMTTLVISVSIAIPLGVNAAVHQGQWQDSACMAIALVCVSIPGFWLSLLLIILFSVKLGWLPALGIGGIKYYVLPALSGSVGGIAGLARKTRSSMLDVIRSDYITTARSKGVPERQVIYKHALKNALIPIITNLGTRFGLMLGGTMITETIFSIPGMGTLIINAVNSRDYPVVQAGSVFLAIVFSFCMLMVDVMYAVADPRIKAQYERMGKKVKKRA